MKDNDVLNQSIEILGGIGQARAKLFNRLGIFTLKDLLHHFPRDYEDRGKQLPVAQLADGDEAVVKVVVASGVEARRPRPGLSMYRVVFKDETGSLRATWFNQPFIRNIFKIGESYVLFGRVTKKFGRVEMTNPVYEKWNESEMKYTCRIIPIYPSTANLSQKMLQSALHEALKKVKNIRETLPLWIINEHGLLSRDEAIRNIHFPENNELFEKARRRLVFEELLCLQLGLLLMKNAVQSGKQGIRFEKLEEEAEGFIRQLPFSLTGAQLRVFKEICSDMESDRVMNRMVQGDVGSGKTIVAALALFKAARSGYQAVMMVPTEILAEQHYSSLISLLENQGIRVGLLTGSLPRSRKEETLFDIKNGLIDVVVGTHALLEDDVEFAKLGLVITDEQHRFGVRQRAALSAKGNNPDILVMTATPIPRTLALVLYGDLDISILDEMPPGRKKVVTYAVDESMRDRIDKFIMKLVEEGRQVYVVCPAVEEGEEPNLRSAVQTAEEMKKGIFSKYSVGLVHGQMPSAEKERVMRDFAEGRINILVATTVIEVGVNVPNASLMVVENAERFGLAQLHQLRGRVGRGEYQSYCILICHSDNEIARERMKVLCSTNDGFVISEKDLELRGPGDFFGLRQHGLPDFKIANLYKDMDILKEVQMTAERIIKEDRSLTREENIVLKDTILKQFECLGEISLN